MYPSNFQVFIFIFIIFDIQLVQRSRHADCTDILQSYKSIRGSSRGIPAAFVVRFMVLRNCSPRSMGRARPTWHQVVHFSWRVLNRAGTIISSVICHDYPEIIGLADSLSATVCKRLLLLFPSRKNRDDATD